LDIPASCPVVYLLVVSTLVEEKVFMPYRL
jgi:hypothetical protein